MAGRKPSTVQRLAIGYHRARLRLLNSLSTRWAASAALDVFSTPYPVPRRPDPPLWALASPLEFFTGTMTLAGYKWLAEKPSGKKMLIVHGLAGSARTFEFYIKSALEKGYDVYAYDAPGHGKSPGNRLIASTYIEIIKGLVEKHGSFDAYIAHSLGGMSLMLALHEISYQNNPHIVLVAPATESVTAAGLFYKMLLIPPKLQHAFEKTVRERVGNHLHWYSISRVLHDIKGNILWLHDHEDQLTPIADVLPLTNKTGKHVQFVFTKGLGHTRIYHDPHVRSRIMDFL